MRYRFQASPHRAKRLDDPWSRLAKARKIAELVDAARPLRGSRVLDVGAGSGIIASSLAEVVGSAGTVWALDLVETKPENKRVQVLRGSATELPIRDDAFDVVVSNHVLEHVGPRDNQLRHLLELRRVLKPDGIAYLAVPNRWSIVEPHFGLPFLSWLPPSLRSSFVRLTASGSHYDANPPSFKELVRLFERAGLRYRDRTMEAIRIMARVETTGTLRSFLLAVPDWTVKTLHSLIPTFVVILMRGTGERRGGERSG